MDAKLRVIRTDFALYCQYIMHANKGVPMQTPEHFWQITEALESVVRGKTKRLIINICPRSGKTEIAVKLFISWCMGIEPICNFIHTTYSHRLAASNAYSVREYMRSDAYTQLFPATSLSQDSQAKDEFKTQQGGTVYAVGAGGAITGFGAGGMRKKFQGAIIIDDIHKASEASSDVMRQNVIEWFSTTLESRKNDPDVPIIIIGQRLHENDLIGHLLSGGNGEDWDLLKIPALKENGESFWAEQFPLKMLERIEQKTPYVFAGQYQQEPAPKTGGEFKPENIEIVEALPANLKFTRGWDFAGTEKKHSDHTATIKLAERDGVVYVAHGYQFKGKSDAVEKSVLQFASLERDVFISLPIDPGQAGIAQAANYSKKLQGLAFECTNESGDKVARAQPIAAQVNAGNVRMLRGDWNSEFIETLRLFPFAKHDDYVDAFSRAYNSLITKNQTLGMLLSRR